MRRIMPQDRTINVSVGGIFPAMLTTLFVGLKLTGYITWSWLWVLSPIWGPAAFFLALILMFAVISLIVQVAKR